MIRFVNYIYLNSDIHSNLFPTVLRQEFPIVLLIFGVYVYLIAFCLFNRTFARFKCLVVFNFFLIFLPCFCLLTLKYEFGPLGLVIVSF